MLTYIESNREKYHKYKTIKKTKNQHSTKITHILMYHVGKERKERCQASQKVDLESELKSGDTTSTKEQTQIMQGNKQRFMGFTDIFLKQFVYLPEILTV